MKLKSLLDVFTLLGNFVGDPDFTLPGNGGSRRCFIWRVGLVMESFIKNAVTSSNYVKYIVWYTQKVLLEMLATDLGRSFMNVGHSDVIE